MHLNKGQESAERKGAAAHPLSRDRDQRHAEPATRRGDTPERSATQSEALMRRSGAKERHQAIHCLIASQRSRERAPTSKFPQSSGDTGTIDA